jgi:hypothetical protein
MKVTFTRLNNGHWGLRSDAPLSEGSTVAVTKRDGSMSDATVGRLLWQGDGVHLYASVLARAPRIAGPGPGVLNTAQRKRADAKRAFRPCGYPGCSPGFCDECDGKGARAGEW